MEGVDGHLQKRAGVRKHLYVDVGPGDWDKKKWRGGSRPLQLGEAGKGLPLPHPIFIKEARKFRELPRVKGLNNRRQFASSSELQECSYIAGEEQQPRHWDIIGITHSFRCRICFFVWEGEDEEQHWLGKPNICLLTVPSLEPDCHGSASLESWAGSLGCAWARIALWVTPAPARAF